MIRMLMLLALAMAGATLAFPLLSLVQAKDSQQPNANAQSGAAEKFRGFLDADWRRWMTEYPEVATHVGFPGQDDRWTDDSPAGIATSLARSSEATAGFAWRPSWTDRVAVLGRYTYLDEALPNAQAQNGPTDPLTGAPLGFRERAHVMSVAGDGRVLWRFSLGEKVAAKRREELTPDGNSSAWMILWINRVTFHVTRAWDALAEYRLLYGPGPALSHGAAVEVNRIIVGHLRLGVGWNFANFSDDKDARCRSEI